MAEHVYEITVGGHTYSITSDRELTDAQVYKAVQPQVATSLRDDDNKAISDAVPDRTWLGAAASSLAGTAADTVKGVAEGLTVDPIMGAYQAVRHPWDTAKALAGGVLTAVEHPIDTATSIAKAASDPETGGRMIGGLLLPKVAPPVLRAAGELAPEAAAAMKGPTMGKVLEVAGEKVPRAVPALAKIPLLEDIGDWVANKGRAMQSAPPEVNIPGFSRYGVGETGGAPIAPVPSHTPRVGYGGAPVVPPGEAAAVEANMAPRHVPGGAPPIEQTVQDALEELRAGQEAPTTVTGQPAITQTALGKPAVSAAEQEALMNSGGPRTAVTPVAPGPLSPRLVPSHGPDTLEGNLTGVIDELRAGGAPTVEPRSPAMEELLRQDKLDRIARVTGGGAPPVQPVPSHTPNLIGGEPVRPPIVRPGEADAIASGRANAVPGPIPADLRGPLSESLGDMGAASVPDAVMPSGVKPSNLASVKGTSADEPLMGTLRGGVTPAKPARLPISTILNAKGKISPNDIKVLLDNNLVTPAEVAAGLKDLPADGVDLVLKDRATRGMGYKAQAELDALMRKRSQ